MDLYSSEPRFGFRHGALAPPMKPDAQFSFIQLPIQCCYQLPLPMLLQCQVSTEFIRLRILIAPELFSPTPGSTQCGTQSTHVRTVTQEQPLRGSHVTRGTLICGNVLFVFWLLFKLHGSGSWPFRVPVGFTCHALNKYCRARTAHTRLNSSSYSKSRATITGKPRFSRTWICGKNSELDATINLE